MNIEEKILIEYIKEQNYAIESIDNYDIDGSICKVVFYSDDSHYYKETININLWKFIFFLEKYKNKHILI